MQSISEIFIKKPIMTTLLMVALLVFGLALYDKLPISDLPSVDSPVITVTASYPGASPGTMASTVAAPLENEFMAISGLKSVLSDSAPGSTTITLNFDLSRNVDAITPDIEAAISRAAGNLPSDLPSTPQYSKNNPSEQPIIYLMITSDSITAGELYDFANKNIAQKLSMIQGVSQVQVWGTKKAVRIQVDPAKLAAYGIGFDEVASTITAGSATIPAGSLNGDFRTFSIEPKGQLQAADAYAMLVLKHIDGQAIRLGAVAVCKDSVNNDYMRVMYGRAGGKARSGSVCLAISRQGTANTVAVAGDIKATLAQLRNELPESIGIDVFYDKSTQIIESVNDVKTTILIALFLVVLVIFLFMGRLTDTVIPGVALPLSIIGTFIIMYVAGFSLDNLSLMGITLSVGFLVDDAIVVLENTVRHVQRGVKPLKAAIISAREITGTVISTSIALVCVFVPLIFMSGVVGRNFREFALTVTFAIVCSTALALILTPMMCGRMLKDDGGKKSLIQKIIDAMVGGLGKVYGFMLGGMLRVNVLSIILWMVCIVGTFYVFMLLPKTFLPTGDSGCVQGALVAPQGVSSARMKIFQDKVNEVLLSDPAVEKIFSISGMSSGADQSSGSFFVILKDKKQRKHIDEVVQRLQKKFFNIPNGMVYCMPLPTLQLSTGGGSTAAGAAYAYTIKGSDREQVYNAAAKLHARMLRMQGLADIQSSVKLNMPQLDVQFFRDRASTLGISVQEIEYALSLAYSGGRVTTYKTDTDQYDVILEVDRDYKKKPDDLASIYLRSTRTGKLIALSSLVKWKPTLGPKSVPHYDQLNSATLSFNLKPGVTIGDATKQLEDAASVILPPEISGSFQGTAQEFQKSAASMAMLLGVAIFVMYVVLGILYESYIHPFTVLTTLPVAAFGGLATLLLYGSELSLYAYIGLFMLLGIVAKNGIMIVDFANQYMAEGKKPREAIYEACVTRFRPILMTGVSSVCGAVPIAMGFGADGESRIPLGLIIVGGLLFAQVITLFVTPGLFLYMQWIQDHVFDRFELLRAGSSRAGELDDDE